MQKRTVITTLAAVLGAVLISTGAPARAGGSCPTGPSVTPSGTGVTWSVDPQDVVAVGVAKTCGSFSTSTDKGHVWVGVAGTGLGPSVGGHSINGGYVAVGNDGQGNPDASNGKDSHCTTNKKRDRYTDDNGNPCRPQRRAGPYACAATDGGASYGPKNGFVFCVRMLNPQ